MFKLAVLVATKKLVFPSVVFGSLGSGDGLFNMPWGSAIDQMDGMYVSDRCNNRIQVVNQNRVFLYKYIGSMVYKKLVSSHFSNTTLPKL